MKTTTLALLAALTTPALALAANSAKFADYRNYLLPSSALALEVTDVNHDGLPDVVAGTGAGVAVLLGHADGTLAPPVTVGANLTTSIAVADFNNDGNPDVAFVFAANGSYLALALGNGDGTFQTPQVLPINCQLGNCTIAAADFNGDGKMDLAVAIAEFNPSVTVYLGNGDGTFRGGQPRYTAQNPNYVIAGDLNQDGKPDLVVSDAISNTLIVLLGNGDGSFRRTNYNIGRAPYGLVLADFNGDGLPDVAAAEGSSTMISVRLNQGGGVLGPPAIYATDCTDCNLQSIAAGDFNRDGKIDLATPASILHGNGDGTFQAPVVFASGSAPITVASGDLNGDGYSDLVVGSSDYDLSVLLGNAQSVRQPPAIAAGSQPRAVAAADFNGDHQTDLAVAVTGANEVQIFLGTGGGHFKMGATLQPGELPGALVAADFNGDGKLDLAVAGENGTAIYLGNGDGTFTAGARYPGFISDCTNNQWPAHSCFATGDFNGDGIPDLVGALWIQDEVFFMLGNGDGTFRPAPTITLSDAPQGLAVGDFNHDGKMDVAVSGLAGTVDVLPGNGDGTFGAPSIIQFQDGGLAGLAIGDVNGDGNLDIVVAGGGGGSLISLGVYIITGNGDLTFNPPVALLADEMPNSILLADLSGSGRLDIASANVMADDVAVFVNKGGLNFAPAVLYGTGASPVMLIGAEVNRDGLLDLLSLNQFANDLNILFHLPQ